MTTRSHSTTTSQSAFDAAYADLDALPDDDVEDMLFADDSESQSVFWSLPTLAGLSLIGVGLAYLLEQMNMPIFDSFDLSFLVEMLPFLAGMFIMLIGFGVFSERRKKKKPSRPSLNDEKASENEKTTETSSSADHFFDSSFFTLDETTITRSRDDRKIAGVCGGLAQYLDIDATLLRIGFLIGLVATEGSVILAYLVLVYVIPNEKEQTTPKRVRITRNR